MPLLHSCMPYGIDFLSVCLHVPGGEFNTSLVADFRRPMVVPSLVLLPKDVCIASVTHTKAPLCTTPPCPIARNFGIAVAAPDSPLIPAQDLSPLRDRMAIRTFKFSIRFD